MQKHDSTKDGSEHNNSHSNNGQNIFERIYDKKYKTLMIFSILLVALSILMIGYQYSTTGDFVNRGVSLTGGISVTLKVTDQSLTSEEIQNHLTKELPEGDFNVRTFGTTTSSNYQIEASGVDEQQLLEALQPIMPAITLEELGKNKQTIGPAFGESFFIQTLKAIFIAFLFMSMIIFMYFGEKTKYKIISAFVSIVAAFTMFYASSIVAYVIAILMMFGLIALYFIDSIPSFGIILCAFSDLMFALAIFNLSGMNLSIAGVAAFLMLVGYSIDTDILLSVRVLKRKEGTVFDRTVDALKTGITMSLCALISALVAYLLTNSVVIKEIMFILIAGLVGDIIFTWIQNAGILRMHLEKKGWK